MALCIPTRFSAFWAACGTIIGSSKSSKTCPLFPRLKIVERFFKRAFVEKKPTKEMCDYYKNQF